MGGNKQVEYVFWHPEYRLFGDIERIIEVAGTLFAAVWGLLGAKTYDTLRV